MICQNGVWLEKHGRLHLQLHLIFLHIGPSDVEIHTSILTGALAVRQVGGCKLQIDGDILVPDIRDALYLQIEDKRVQGATTISRSLNRMNWSKWGKRMLVGFVRLCSPSPRKSRSCFIGSRCCPMINNW